MTTSAGQRELTVGMGAGGLATADMVLNIGPQHPATHGVLRLRIVVDGERIVSAEPIVGYMHRGAEKLFEVRDYRQIIVLANRHDWLSAFSNELGVVLGVERMLGMEVPERAVWARTLLAELNRVLNHLMFLGSYPLELGAITPIFYAFREREELQAVMEEASGGRMHYMFNRVGGLKEDLPAGWLGRVSRAVGRPCGTGSPTSSRSSSATRSSRPARAASACSRPRSIAAYGVSGPIARASGVDLDLRRDEPYLAYAELFAPGGPGRVVTRTAGDCLARLEVLLEQVHVSLDLAEACLDRLALAAPRPGQRAAAQGAQGARGRPLHRDREPARPQRLLPRLARGEDARGGSSCARRRSTTSRCSPRCCPATSSPTWWRSWARCSSSSATSTSSASAPVGVLAAAALVAARRSPSAAGRRGTSAGWPCPAPRGAPRRRSSASSCQSRVR